MRPSKKRLGLLKLLMDRNGQAYLPAFTSLELEKYDLNLWDTAVVVWTEKVGLIKYDKPYTHAFIKITELGKQLLIQYEKKTIPPDLQIREYPKAKR